MTGKYLIITGVQPVATMTVLDDDGISTDDYIFDIYIFPCAEVWTLNGDREGPNVIAMDGQVVI